MTKFATGRRPPVALWLCLLWAMFIVYGTTIPFRLVPNRAWVVTKWRLLTPNPFYALANSFQRVALGDVAQNVLLFLPLGILGVSAAAHRSISPSPQTRALKIIAAGAAFSAAVEGLQLFETDRVSSIADIV